MIVKPPARAGGSEVGRRLSGLAYRLTMNRLKAFGFAFDRQAAGSHEIRYNPQTGHYATIPNHSGEMPEGTLRAILKQADIDFAVLASPPLQILFSDDRIRS